MKKKKRSYIKLFNIPHIAKQAMVMLSKNPPTPYSIIAEKLGCDRSSVIHFHKKKIREGITLQNFNGVHVEIVDEIKPKEVEVFNVGKSYKDYLKKYVKKRNTLQSKQMRKAKKTIDKLNRDIVGRKLDIELDIWDF